MEILKIMSMIFLLVLLIGTTNAYNLLSNCTPVFGVITKISFRNFPTNTSEEQCKALDAYSWKFAQITKPVGTIKFLGNFPNVIGIDSHGNWYVFGTFNNITIISLNNSIGAHSIYVKSHNDSNVYYYPKGVFKTTLLSTPNYQPLLQITFCQDKTKAIKQICS